MVAKENVVSLQASIVGGLLNVSYSLPSMNVNPREWIKDHIYEGVNS